MDDVYFILLVGGFKHELCFPSYMGCHPNPIDELHHFSRLLLHHQPDIRYLPDIKTEHIFLDIGGDVSMEK